MQREEQTGDVVTKTILADSSNESVRLSLHSQQQCLYSLLNFLGKLWLRLGSSMIRIVSNVSMKPTLRTLTSLPNSGKWLVILRLLLSTHHIISHNIVIGQTDSSFIFSRLCSQCWSHGNNITMLIIIITFTHHKYSIVINISRHTW